MEVETACQEDKMLRSLNSRITFSLIGIVAVTIITLMIMVKRQAESSIQDIQKANALNLLDIITYTVEHEYRSIQFHRQKVLARRKAELKDVVDIGSVVLQEYFDKYKSGLVSKELAQEEAIQAIKRLRWADEVGYFWINDTSQPTPMMIMHPTRPDLDGKVLDDPEFNCALGKDENLFRAFNRVCRDQGSGYVDYLWPKPVAGGHLTSKQPKISYVRLFQPWDWIIGSGVYIDDIDKEAQERVDAVIEALRETFKDLRFGESSYMFMFTKERETLIHPTLEGQNIEELKNPDTGLPLADEIMLAAQSSARYLDYRWAKPSGAAHEIFRKRLYVQYFEPLEWYICVSYYIDEIEKPIWELAIKMLLLSVVFLAAALLLALLLGKNLTTPLRKLSDAAEKIRMEGLGSVEIPVSGSTETRELGQILSQALSSAYEKETSLEKSEEALRNAQDEQLRQLEFTSSLLESIPIPVFFMDNEMRFIGCNKAYSDFMGIATESILGHTPKELWSTNIAGDYSHIIQGMTGPSQPVSHDLQVSARDGGRHDVILSKNVFHDETGDVSGVIVAFQDITERKKAERAVRLSEENLRITLDSIADGVITTDIEGRISRMNRVAVELTGWPFEKACGKVLLDGIKLMDSSGNFPLDSPISVVLETGEAMHMLRDAIMITAAGNKYVVSTACSPVCNPDQTMVGAVFAFRDITEQSRIEEQLRQSQKMDALGQLAGGVAHDFNNMLAAMMGAAELLNVRLPKEDDNRPFVKMIIDSAEKAAGLTDKLLSFSRKGKLLSTAINVHESIADVVALLQRSIDKRVEIEQNLDAEVATIVGDPSQIQSMLINLGVNAGHAMPDGGTLTISTQNIAFESEYYLDSNFKLNPGNYLEIRVADTGTGIEPDVLDRIFEPFFTTKGVGEGTGLGLAAVYGAVKGHHGGVMVHSQLGEGTIFYLFLPVESNIEVQPRVNMEYLRKGSGTILVVDDESIIRLTAKHTLRDMGYDVILAENGRDALAIYEVNREKIDLVILDMVMPKMNGEQTFRAIRELDPDAKVIMASGFTEETEVLRLKKDGLLSFIKKPYRRIDLNRILTDLIG